MFALKVANNMYSEMVVCSTETSSHMRMYGSYYRVTVKTPGL